MRQALEMTQEEFVIVTSCVTLVAGLLGKGLLDQELLANIREIAAPRDIRNLSDKLDTLWHSFGLPQPEKP